MALTPEERKLEAQQGLNNQSKTNEPSIGTTKSNVDPNECPSCRYIKIACKCKGGGRKKGEKEEDDMQEKQQDQTSSTINFYSQVKLQLTPFKLVLLPSNKKISKEHLEGGEFYEIQEGKTPQNVLAFFNAYINRLAAIQNKTLADLTKEGFSGKIEGSAVMLTFPNEKEREKFRQTAADPKISLIKPTLLNSNNSNSIAQQMVLRMINPQNRRGQ